MKPNHYLLPGICCALLFTLLFHRQDFGLNILLADGVILALLYFTGKLDLRQRLVLTMTAGFLLSGLAVVFVYSPFVIVVHFICLFLFGGMLLYTGARSLLTTFFLAVCNLMAAQIEFGQQLSKRTGDSRWGVVLRRSRVFLIPVVIVAVFLGFYRCSNPVFDQLAGKVDSGIGTFFGDVFGRFDGIAVFVFLLCLFVVNFLLLKGDIPADIVANDEKQSDSLTRTRERTVKNLKPSLKQEYKAGLFLLISLNLLLGLVNVIDIDFVWLNFNWEGQYLKQFVHEGTYILILSILFSGGIVLYFFRGNLNFYEKNVWLKRLCYVWLIQNGFLALSVAMRNYHYISNFGLAYLRIALLFFLCLVLYGLYVIYMKIHGRRSQHFFLRRNLMAAYIVMVATTFINWEGLIVRYNFAHSDTAFLHFEFLTDCPDKTLPELDRDVATMTAIREKQIRKFDFAAQSISPEVYVSTIAKRKAAFRQKWQSKSWLSWNYREWKAYRELGKGSRF